MPRCSIKAIRSFGLSLMPISFFRYELSFLRLPCWLYRFSRKLFISIIPCCLIFEVRRSICFFGNFLFRGVRLFFILGGLWNRF